MSGKPQQNDVEEFPNPVQKRMLKGAGIGAAINAGLGVVVCLTPMFSQLAGPGSMGSRIAAALITGAVTGGFLGVLLSSPKNSEPS